MNKDSMHFEKGRGPLVREARPEDMPRLVEVDLECFQDVYEANPVDPQEIQAMLETRQSIAKDLMVVGEIDGSIEGFMTCQRIGHEADQIKSWEETTNSGTLVGTHIPTGKNFYIVNLTVTDKGTEHDLSDQLIARLLGRFLEIQGEETYLLSRMPQFSQWLEESQIDFESLSDDVQDEFAQEYIGATKTVEGKEYLYDGMLRRYGEFGAKPVTVLRDGFVDPASHNYSVLCVFKNPLPEKLKRSRLVSRLAGLAVRYAANHPKVLSRLP